MDEDGGEFELGRPLPQAVVRALEQMQDFQREITANRAEVAAGRAESAANKVELEKLGARASTTEEEMAKLSVKLDAATVVWRDDLKQTAAYLGAQSTVLSHGNTVRSMASELADFSDTWADLISELGTYVAKSREAVQTQIQINNVSRKILRTKKAMADLCRAVAQIGVDFPDLNVGAVLALCPFDYNNVDQITGIGS
jgi:hypothetical protein